MLRFSKIENSKFAIRVPLGPIANLVVFNRVVFRAVSYFLRNPSWITIRPMFALTCLTSSFNVGRIIKFHKTYLGNKSITLPNSEVTRRFRPLDEVAIYVPGGKASYISTVLMAAGPARAAGAATVRGTGNAVSEDRWDMD